MIRKHIRWGLWVTGREQNRGRTTSQDRLHQARYELVRAGPSVGTTERHWARTFIRHRCQTPLKREAAKMRPIMPVSPQKCGPTRALRRMLQNCPGEMQESCRTCAQSPKQGPWGLAGGKLRKRGEKPEKVLAMYFTFTLSTIELGRRHPSPGVQKPGWSPSYHS